MKEIVCCKECRYLVISSKGDARCTGPMLTYKEGLELVFFMNKFKDSKCKSYKHKGDSK